MSCNRRRKQSRNAFNVVPRNKDRQELEERRIKEAYRKTMDSTVCPNDGALLILSPDPKLSGCLECPSCGFVQGSGMILVHTEKGTPSQVISVWDRLAREDEKPS